MCWICFWTTWTRWYLWGIQWLVSTHYLGRKGVFLTTQNSKSQVLVKFPFSRGGGEGGILGYSELKVSSLGQISIFVGRGLFLTTLELILLAKWIINSGSPTCSCITDSVSHTMCVETNQLFPTGFHWCPFFTTEYIPWFLRILTVVL